MARRAIPHSLNICLVAEKFPILGRAADHGFLWPVAKGLANLGHKVTVLSWKNPQGKKEIVQNNVHAHFLGVNSFSSIREFPTIVERKFRQLHNATPFHIVHSIDGSGYLIGRKKKEYQVAMTYDVEATHMSELFQILGYSQETITSLLKTSFSVGYRFLKTYLQYDRRLLNTADSVIVTSPQQRILLERYYLYPDTKIFTVPYGIEIGDLSPREKSEELRKKFSIPGNANTVVTMTDMTELGETIHLLRAFEKLAVKKPASRLIIVGKGPLQKAIEFELLSLALGGKVIFTGNVDNADLHEYIALGDIYVNLSSRTSGFEPSTLEAMAQKKIIIGSEVSPIATIVESGKDGYLVRPADSLTLSRLFMDIFNGQISVDGIGEAARQKVMNLFDTRKMVRMTLGAYYGALSHSGYYKRKEFQIMPASQEL